jgi:Icc-related predicted phosphoesterase
MKLGIISDLHLDSYRLVDVYDIVDSIVEQSSTAGINVLLIAGDTSNDFRNPIRQILFSKLGQANITWLDVIGNHDNYGHYLQDERSKFNLEGVGFTLATLWTDCHNDPLTEIWFRKNMPDAREILDFSIAKMKFVHECQKKYIFDSPTDVVMTHNPPSLRSVSAAYQGKDMANKAFMPELEQDVYYSGIKLWVCGHVHHKHEYHIGKTKIVCNPLGYRNELYKNPLDYKIQVEEIWNI